MQRVFIIFLVIIHILVVLNTFLLSNLCILSELVPAPIFFRTSFFLLYNASFIIIYYLFSLIDSSYPDEIVFSHPEYYHIKENVFPYFFLRNA